MCLEVSGGRSDTRVSVTNTRWVNNKVIQPDNVVWHAAGGALAVILSPRQAFMRAHGGSESMYVCNRTLPMGAAELDVAQARVTALGSLNHTVYMKAVGSASNLRDSGTAEEGIACLVPVQRQTVLVAGSIFEDCAPPYRTTDENRPNLQSKQPSMPVSPA